MKNTYVFGIVILIVIAGLVYVRNHTDKQEHVSSTKYDEFASCLADKGAIFYGAYWCPHCKEQKELFEFSDKLPYVECAMPNSNNQKKECADAGVKSYPTWTFTDGTTEEGALSLEHLGEKTGCVLPSNS